jgi:hypothetical protein
MRFSISASDESRVSTLRTSTSIFLSRQVYRVATSPRTFATTVSAISRTTRPRRAARSWSNTIWISGLPSSTVLRTSAKRGDCLERLAQTVGCLVEALQFVADELDFQGRAEG